MPSSPPGDPDHDGPDDDDFDDDEVGFRPPLPPEDRLWRHPSEVAMAARARQSTARPPQPRWRIGVGIGLGTALVGATLTLAVLAAGGGSPRPVVEREDRPAVAGGDDRLAAIEAHTMPSVVGLTATAGDTAVTGNAVAVRDDGYLLTTASLIADAEAITIHLHDGRSAPAHAVGTDEVTDLAVLRSPDVSLPPAEMGSADDLAAGDETYVLGWRLESEWVPAATVGVVTATRSRFVYGSSTYHGMVLIDTDDLVRDPGCPIFDERGALIGLANGYARNGSAPTTAAVTPIDVAARVTTQLIESGRATDVWLGVGGSDLDGEVARSLGIDGGAHVSTVKPDSPAAAAGLHDGDVITDVDGERVQSMSDLIGKLRERRPGDEIVITVLRDNAAADVATTLIERFDPDDLLGEVEVPPADSDDDATRPGASTTVPQEPSTTTSPTTVASSVTTPRFPRP